MTDKPQVVKLAQPGIDVKTAGDEHLVYNSNWPLLKIYKQGSFTTTQFNDVNQVVVPHDLGYVPMVWCFANVPISNWLNPTTLVTENGRSEFQGYTYYAPTINNKALMFRGGYGLVPTGATRFYYYIFALDIETAYNAPIIKSGGVIGPRNTKTVFKLAKPGKDISSTNPEDFVVDSQARSPLVHAVYKATAPFTFYHNLGYAPMIFAYNDISNDGSLSPGEYRPLFADGTGASGFSIDAQKIQATNAVGGTEVAIVVLKDPFEVSDVRAVTV